MLKLTFRAFGDIYSDIKAIADQNGLNKTLNFVHGGVSEQMRIRFDAAVKIFDVCLFLYIFSIQLSHIV